MDEMLTDFLEFGGFAAKGWESGGFGDSVVCPCGNEIELDGECPQGCVSPLMTAGLI